MAETLLSPGVFTRENDNSFIAPAALEAGAAFIGPTVKGPVEVPTVVTSYGQYQNIFGTTFESGSTKYEHLTSLAVKSYFNNGGNSAIIGRVVSGSFSRALNTRIAMNGLETGQLEDDADALLSSITTNTTAPVGYLVTEADALLGSITGNAAILASGSQTITDVSLTGGSGTGAVASVGIASGSNGVGSITVTTAGYGYVSGDTLTISSGSVFNLTDVTITLDSGDVVAATGERTFSVSLATVSGSGTGAEATITINSGSTQIDGITVTSAGTGYVLGDIVSVASGSSLNNSTAALITLEEDDIVDAFNPFTIETLGQGEIFNCSSASTHSPDLNSDGSMKSGSRDNIRWEISNLNSSRGTFSLQVRRGDDSTKNKIVLETFNDLSLDPNSENYIESVIGNQYKSKTVDSDGSVYVQTYGEYVNRSNYIRIASVNNPTLDYLNTDGITVRNNAFTASLPIVQSGSFQGATGMNYKDGVTNNFFENIDADNTQGLVAANYTDVISILGNKDEYVFNIVSAPGLIYEFGSHKIQLDSIISLAESRGDCISVIDVQNYGSTVSNAVGTAGNLNSSYAATYWPWLQTLSATGKNVWIPASTVIPGVYAFTDGASAPWFAPAGLTRGGLSDVIQAERKLTRTQRDSLYSANVNPIATFPGTGISVFGQKTLQKKNSALDRVNVRRLLIDLKKFVGDVSRTLVFEQNTTVTRNAFLAQVNPYLESVVQRQGLYAFKVVMDDTNNTADVIDRNQLIGQILVQPARTVEFIVLDFTIEPTGASFGA